MPRHESSREKFIEALMPRVLIPLTEAAPMLGIGYQNARAILSRNKEKFPVKVHRQGRRVFVHIDVLADYLFSLPTEQQSEGRRRGRPTKREELSRKGVFNEH